MTASQRVARSTGDRCSADWTTLTCSEAKGTIDFGERNEIEAWLISISGSPCARGGAELRGGRWSCSIKPGLAEAFEDWNAAVAASVMRYSPAIPKGGDFDGKIVYQIVEHDGGWAYKVGGVFSEPFPSHEAAVAAAQAGRGRAGAARRHRDHRI